MAALVVSRYSHEEKRLSPRKAGRPRHAARKASYVTSRASSALPHIRSASRYTGPS